VRLVILKIVVSIEKKMRFLHTLFSKTIIEEFQIEASSIPQNVSRQAIVVWWLRQKIHNQEVGVSNSETYF
jgi:hypothetical protein